MSTDSFVRAPSIQEDGSVHIDNALVSTSVGSVQRQRVEVYSGETLPVDINATGESLPVMPVELAIAKTGLLDGKTTRNVYVHGRRTTFNGTTPFQDIATYLTTQNALNSVSAATEYFIVSTNAADSAAGAGVHKVRIVSLNAAGVQQVTEATLTGTTKVSIGSGYSAFQWMETSALGSGGGSAAVGNIAIFSGAGASATVATTVEQILATGNRSLSGRYTVPTGYKAYMVAWTGSSPGSQTMDIRLRADCFADDRTRSAGIFHFQASAALPAASAPFNESLDYRPLPAGTMVKASAYPGGTTGTPRCDVNISLLLVAD